MVSVMRSLRVIHQYVNGLFHVYACGHVTTIADAESEAV